MKHFIKINNPKVRKDIKYDKNYSSIYGLYESFDYELSENLTEIEKGIAELAVTATKKIYENIEISFQEDGKCTLGSYTQDGSKLMINNTEFKASGNKIVLKIEEKNYSLKVVFIVKK